MSEEFTSEYNYKDEDIVWVKLGPSWWPGEVKDLDTLPSEVLDFKKPPLVIVKFFDEDSYEYVKSWSSIFPYNCERKNDFIKKGMAGFRSKQPHMEKFPKDVTTAELKTGGNPNILSESMFLPEKKTNIVAEIFGTPSPKGKVLKDKKQRSSMKQSRDLTYITHRRFLGADDYKAFICIQYPGKDRVNGDSEDEEVIRINIEPDQEFTCHSCSFTTKRLEVLVLHTKSHIQGDYVPGVRRPKRPVAIRKKKDKRKQRVEDASTGTDSSDNEVSRPPKQKKRKTKTTKAKKDSETEKPSLDGKPEQRADIRSNLLAEWDLSDDDMNGTNDSMGDDDSKLAESLDDTVAEQDTSQAKETVVEKGDKVVMEDDILIVEHEVVTAEDGSVTVEEGGKPKMDKETQEAIKSCFDFDEDDEEEHAIIINTSAASGRKIPRVIPPTERRKSDDLFAPGEEEIRAFDKEEILKVSESFNRKGGEEMDASFEELMEKTAVPDLPEVRNVLKCEQNFHCVKTIKFPDKSEEVGNSPKRKKREKAQTSKSETETPVKPINPKKRFVKSFEDFENEIRRKEQQDELQAQKLRRNAARSCQTPKKTDADKLEEKESTSSDKFEESEIELKTKILSRIIDEANMNEESKIKIMSKMQKKPRTPRNKILESYMKDESEGDIASEVTVTPDKNISEISTKEEMNKHKSELNEQLVEEMKITQHEDVVKDSNASEESTNQTIEPTVETQDTTAQKKQSKTLGISRRKKSRRNYRKKQQGPKKFKDDDSQINASSDEAKVESKDSVQYIEPLADQNQPKSENLKEPHGSQEDEMENLIVQEEKSENTNQVDSPDKKELLSHKETVECTEIQEVVSGIVDQLEAEDTRKSSTAEVSEKHDSNKDVNCTSEIEINKDSEMKQDDVDEINKIGTEPEKENNVSRYIKEGSQSCTEEIQVASDDMEIVEKTNPIVSKENVETNPVASSAEEIHDSEDTKNSKLPEDDSLSFSLISQTESDDYSPIGQASLHLPEDAILQPKKHRKRKHSRHKSTAKKKRQSKETEKPDEEKHVEDTSIVIPTSAEEAVASSKDNQVEKQENELISEAQVIEETIHTEEVALDDTLIKDSQGSIPEALVVEEVIQECVQKNQSTVSVDQVQSDIECIEVVNNEIIMADEDIHQATNLIEEQVHSEPPAMTDDTENEMSETVELAVSKHGDTSEEELEAESLSNVEVFKQQTQKVPEDILGYTEGNNDITEEPVGRNEISVEQSLITETEETIKAAVDESISDTIEKLQEISKEILVEEDINSKVITGEESVVQEFSKKIDPSEYFESSDKAHDLVEDPEPVNLEGEKEADISEANMDLEPPFAHSEKIIVTETVSSKHETTNDVPAAESEVPPNEIEIQCSNNAEDQSKFSIQTNLSNMTSREELSVLALTSLADLKSSFDSDSNPEKTDIILSEKISEPELVAIEANLTVVSEKDLADGQVEITTEKVISAKKTAVLSHFSVDFSDSTNDSTVDTSDPNKSIDFDSKGTEFSSKAITKQLRPKTDTKRSNAYEQYELLDILEGTTSDAEKKAALQQRGKALADDICDFEEHIPSQIVCSAKFKHDIDEMKNKEAPKSSVMSTTSKLMERLTEDKTSDAPTATDNPAAVVTAQDVVVSTPAKIVPSIVKAKVRPIIISEQIIRPASSKAVKPSEKPQQNVMDDIEDVEAFVIHKDIKKHVEDEPEPSALSPNKLAKKQARSRSIGKAKILQQTIITPEGEVIQPATSKIKKPIVRPILVKPAVVKSSSVDLPTVNPSIISSSIKTQILKSGVTSSASAAAVTVSNPQDDNDFDINSMPIVLSDSILTPESIENMPIVIGGEARSAANKTEGKVVVKPAPLTKLPAKTIAVTVPPLTTKTIATQKLTRPRILQSVASKATKIPTSTLPNTTNKSGKYILVPQGSLGATQLQGVSKKAIVKRSLPAGSSQPASEPTGNKIMIVTNQQGQQQRLLLTPAQQKMLGYQNQGQKITKAVVKGNVLTKTILAPKGLTSNEPTVSKVGQKVSVGPNLVPISSQALANASLQGRSLKAVAKKVPVTSQKPQGSKTPKTILITTKHGQTVKKITTTDDDIEKQVAAQLEAIKASTGMKFGSSSKLGDALGGKVVQKPPPKRSYPKKVEAKQKVTPSATVSSRTEYMSTPPPLVGTSSKKPLTAVEPPKPDRPLNQLVIQDAVGNQTTITEGQILALPNETVGGQPHSYVLVTLDQSGNLTPLNNEALMSLDPNLGLGGDLSNMVLQIDQATLNAGAEQPLPLAQAATVKISHPGETLQAGTSKIDIPSSTAPVSIPMMGGDFVEPPAVSIEAPPCEISLPEPPVEVQAGLGEPGQQLIVTGDPVATQKFLESLGEGTADLANIIANAEGKSILIQAGDQQILINANPDNHAVMRPAKSTDILAAALADTDVFSPPKLSPGGALYPMNVGNVLETSLTLGSPIMTPLEVPSTNAKKVEVDVLTQQVPKNVDLPITITDPNISQTVANQQVMVNDLQSNLELNLSGVATSMTGPSFSFSLPSLDEGVVDVGHKTFNSSMPLLTDDVDDPASTGRKLEREEAVAAEVGRHDLADGTFLDVESRFTLGGEMCSSLSEPPPEMFDIAEVNSFMEKHSNGAAATASLHSSDALSKDGGDTTDFSTHAESSSNEGSCEIPLQSKIVANFDAVGRFGDDDSSPPRID